jgi:hypothetical protein
MIRNKDFDRRVGKMTKLLAKAKGVPMIQVAEDIGMGYSALNARLAGDTAWLGSEIDVIAEYFEVPFGLFEGDAVEELLELMRDRQEATTASRRLARSPSQFAEAA